MSLNFYAIFLKCCIDKGILKFIHIINIKKINRFFKAINISVIAKKILCNTFSIEKLRKMIQKVFRYCKFYRFTCESYNILMLIVNGKIN